MRPGVRPPDDGNWHTWRRLAAGAAAVWVLAAARTAGAVAAAAGDRLEAAPLPLGRNLPCCVLLPPVRSGRSTASAGGGQRADLAAMTRMLAMVEAGDRICEAATAARALLDALQDRQPSAAASPGTTAASPLVVPAAIGEAVAIVCGQTRLALEALYATSPTAPGADRWVRAMLDERLGAGREAIHAAVAIAAAWGEVPGAHRHQPTAAHQLVHALREVGAALVEMAAQ